MSTGPRRLGKYELRERLGRGGMAEVWKALDVQLERYVAIKFLHGDLQNDPDFMKRFVREAQVVASLRHPNIVQVHDFQISAKSDEDITAYMVMDYIQGQTLTEYIRSTSRVGQFPPAAEIVHLFICISSAIDYAHQRNMIHRDIKPANILLDKRSPSPYQMGEPILTDFGIVKLLGSSTGTLSGGWLGTPLYVAPEQAQGHAGTERSDIYSLGVILYEICTGVRPFQGDSPVSIIMQHIMTMPNPPALINPQIPPALTDVIMRSLAKDPAARFPSASSMTLALAQALNIPTTANLGMLPPSSSALPTTGSPSVYHPAALTPNFGLSASNQQNVSSSGRSIDSMTPLSNTPGRDKSGPYSVASSAPSLPTITPLPSPRPVPSRRRRGLLVALIAALILVLIGSGLGTFFLLSHKGPVAINTPQIVGHASYASTGLLSGDGSLGIENELEIDLHNIPDPAPGKSYYAWLLSDKIPSQALLCGSPTPTVSILLGALPVDHGNIHFRYPGDPQYGNLLGMTSRLLITEESASSTPSHPSTDQHTWRYYAELPQKPDPTYQNQTSALDHMRCLLYQSAILQAVGLQDGVDTQFFKNTQKVLELANSAVNSWDSKDPASIHLQLVLILDYLDGGLVVHNDVSGPVLVDGKLAAIPLLDLGYGQAPESYLIRMHDQLASIASDTNREVTSGMRMLATQADQALANVQTWFQKIHQDAKQLVQLNNTQLLQNSSLLILEDLETQANYANNGQINSSTNEVQLGVLQITDDVQRLATFDVTPYTVQ